MTFTTVLFYLLAAVLVIAAFRVITARSPVTAVMHLILAFANAAMLWMLLGAEFLALLLVLVYVGAVMVLFLFVVMMLDIRIDALRGGLKTYLPLGLVIGLVMVVEMAFVLGSTWYGAGPQAPVAGDYNNARALGELMYTQYVYAIEVGAALLLVGMVAAIALTLRRRRDVKYNDPVAAVRVRAKDRFRLVSMPAQSERALAKQNGTQADAAAPQGENNDADAGPLPDPRGDPVRHRHLRHLPEPPQPHHPADVHRAGAPGRQHELRGVFQLVRRRRRPGVRVLHPDRGRRRGARSAWPSWCCCSAT